MVPFCPALWRDTDTYLDFTHVKFYRIHKNEFKNNPACNVVIYLYTTRYLKWMYDVSKVQFLRLQMKNDSLHKDGSHH